MKELILVRHAKAVDGLSISDRDRSLAVSGVQTAYKVAGFFCNYHPSLPECWISSPATRAVSTAIIFARAFKKALSLLKIEESLYTFSRKELQANIFSLDDRFKSVIVFGHNNAIVDFINDFSDTPVAGFSTSSVALMHFEVKSWKNLSIGRMKKLIDPQSII